MTTDTTAPLNGRARLEAARAAAADLAARKAGMEQGEPDDLAATVPILEVGATFHAVLDGLTLPRTTSMWGGLPAIITQRGRSYTLTSEMLEASRNKFGAIGWPSIVNSPDEQVRRWGRVFLSAGEAPESMQPWLPGSPEWREAREKARREAWSAPTDAERAYALAEVQRTYGDAPVTSHTHNSAPHPSIREAELQQQRLADRAGRGEL